MYMYIYVCIYICFSFIYIYAYIYIYIHTYTYACACVYIIWAAHRKSRNSLACTSGPSRTSPRTASRLNYILYIDYICTCTYMHARVCIIWSAHRKSRNSLACTSGPSRTSPRTASRLNYILYIDSICTCTHMHTRVCIIWAAHAPKVEKFVGVDFRPQPHLAPHRLRHQLHIFHICIYIHTRIYIHACACVYYMGSAPKVEKLVSVYFRPQPHLAPHRLRHQLYIFHICIYIHTRIYIYIYACACVYYMGSAPKVEKLVSVYFRPQPHLGPYHLRPQLSPRATRAPAAANYRHYAAG